MELALEIPLNHWDTFAPECDFHYALAQLVLENKNYAKIYRSIKTKLFLDNGFNELRKDIGIDSLLKAYDLIEPTHVTALEAFDPEENIKAVIKTKTEFAQRGIKTKLVGCWRGGKKDLDILLEVCDIVALPYDDFREKALRLKPSGLFHFFGFKNLDEIRRHPPRSLDTSVPIRAAMLGISLRTRERRPKNLPLFNLQLKLTKEQIELALDNIRAIKEIGGEK
jgi:hypothetical protein